MTLHKTIDLARKLLLGVGIGFGSLIVIYLLFQLGVIIKNIMFPPPIHPPTVTYGKLPAITFPSDATTKKLTYSLNTVSGTFPEFPDRLAIFELDHPQPNFLNLNKAKEKAGQLRFVDENGVLLAEKKIDSATYQWSEKTGAQRKLTFDIINFNFNLESNFLSRQPEQLTYRAPNTTEAVTKVTSLLNSINLTPDDLDLQKTTQPDEQTFYVTKPQFFAIKNSQLVPVTGISDAQVIRVDLYQKDLVYSLDTGQQDVTGGIKKQEITIPILYPHPPYSTMNFWVASSDVDSQVAAVNFLHQKPLITDEDQATYPLKTAEEAFENLKQGKGYIAAYFGDQTDISITNVYLAYYLGDPQEKYSMPVVVFEGNNGFFAYISAITDDFVE